MVQYLFYPKEQLNRRSNVTRYQTVTKCLIDEQPTIKQFNLDEYSSYTEEFR